MEAIMERFYPPMLFMLDAFFSFFSGLWHALRQRETWRGAFCVFMIGMLAIFMVGCSLSQVQTDITKVLQLLPTIGDIATSILAIVAAAKSGTISSAVSQTIATALTAVKTGFTDAQTIISAYQSNIAAMPATVLNQLDAAVAAVQSNITTIQSQFPQLPAALVAGINVGLLSFEAILGDLAAIIPASVASTLLPRSFQALSSGGIVFGTGKAVIPTHRDFARSYNDKIKTAGFSKVKGATIHVPWYGHLVPAGKF